MSRLIAVSHRVQIETEDEHASRSALAVALSAALRESHGFWFGWSGEEAATFTGQITFRSEGGIATAAVDLDQQDIADYCHGFASRTLWPLFHHRPDLTETVCGSAQAYARVTRRIAETLTPLIQPDDLVWVHDYHLIPLGQQLRDHGGGNRIGFFLHIPWPPSSLLLSLPEHRELGLAMLAYDVVGFQTDEWRHAFIDHATNQIGATLDGDVLCHAGRRTRVLVCPIGLDAADFGGAVHSLLAKQAETRLAISAVGRDLVVGVDRLEPSKGLEERFVGYELLLANHPALREKVCMLQIVPPARDDAPGDRQTRAGLEALSGRINGTFAAIDWVPIHFVNRAFARDELFGIYRAARVGLVTPFRDGMNLVAKEYVAAQDAANPGVLVLSCFAGAAAQLTQAVIVNPHSPQDIAEGIARALAMPLAERQSRHKAMMDTITRQDARWWSDTFLGALAEVSPIRSPPRLAATPQA